MNTLSKGIEYTSQWVKKKKRLFKSGKHPKPHTESGNEHYRKHHLDDISPGMDGGEYNVTCKKPQQPRPTQYLDLFMSPVST